MKKRVYDYIASHPNTSIRQCAEALHVPDLDAMRTILDLSKEGYLKCMVLPLGNERDADTSSFYSVCKTYNE